MLLLRKHEMACFATFPFTAIARFLAAGATTLGCAAALADDVHSFNFEAVAPGNYTALSLTDNGLTVTITRFGGWTFDIFTAPGNFPPSWGNNALSPFNQVSGGAFILQFSAAITGIAADVGDFGQDADNFSLIVGSTIASGSQLATQSMPAFATRLTLTSVNGTQAVLSGGSGTFPQSVYWDNIVVTTATAVPEPAAWMLALAGLAAMAVRAGRPAKNCGQ